MAQLIACGRGLSLPYSSLFHVTSSGASPRAHKSKSSDYYWKKATNPNHSSDTSQDVGRAPESNEDDRLEPYTPSLSDGGDETIPQLARVRSRTKKPMRLTRIRRIAFKVFRSSPDSQNRKRDTITRTEILSRQTHNGQGQSTVDNPNGRLGLNIFKSWKFRSSATKTQVKKMVVVLKDRISASSPHEKHPTSWLEYNRLYCNGEIDVCNPPLPSFALDNEGKASSEAPFTFYSAPRPANEPVRQLVVNRLGILGKPFDPTEEGSAKANARIEIGDKLIAEGNVPSSLDVHWEGHGSIANDGHSFNIEETRTMIGDVRSGKLPPETLEQHPIFRNVVKRCRELFGSAVSILSILDDDRQIFLAESGLVEAGLGAMREVTRDIAFCAHTILSDRKGLTVLDAQKDWRFGNGPLVEDFGARFYAGVPLMAPNLDGSKEGEENTCPIGTLCVLDFKPRESFSAEDQKKLVYLSEYARREIEKWFASKIAAKIARLSATQEVWNRELRRVTSSHSDGDDSLLSELPPDTPTTYQRRTKVFGKCKSISSISTAPTSAPSHCQTSPNPTSPTRIIPSLFEDFNAAVKPKMRKVFDLATKLVAETLDLSLVYLMAVVPYGESDHLGRTMIISGHNIPLPVPELDAGLHLRVLVAGEGGLLYQNPSVEESEEVALQPKISTDGPADPYVSAILLAVGPQPLPNTGCGGFVLAGFTKDQKRVFGAEDVSYMKQFAQQLSVYTSRLPLK